MKKYFKFKNIYTQKLIFGANIKRLLSFALAFALLCSISPISPAYAITTEEQYITYDNIEDAIEALTGERPDSKGTNISLEMEDSEGTGSMLVDVNELILVGDETVATSGVTQSNESEKFYDDELIEVYQSKYDIQPQSLENVQNYIYDYWFNSKGTSSQSEKDNSDLPKFQNEVPSDLLPSAWNCIYIEDSDSEGTSSSSEEKEFSYYTLELNFSFTPQPTSIDDVQSEINKLMPDFYKPMWQFEVTDELMPSGYSCDVIYDEELGVRYYSWFMGIKAINTVSFDDITNTLTLSGTGELTLTIVRNALITYGGYQNATVNIIIEGYTSIADEAFYSCYSLTSVIIGNSVESIGNTAFSGSGLTSIVIPDNVKSIGAWAFQSCDSLTSITIGNGVTSISNSIFSGTAITTITIPDNVTSIGHAVFAGCTSLESIVIPNGVTTIGELAFSGCSSLTSVTIGNGVTSIGTSAFSYCSLLTSIVIPDSVTTIGNSAFQYCTSLESIIIPNSVTTIGDEAFNCCDSLTSIVIPDSVTSIGEFAFTSGFRSTQPLDSLEIIKLYRYEHTNNSDLIWPEMPDYEYIITWMIKKITFNYDGATSNNSTTDIYVTYEDEVGTLPTPKKTDYKFDGWYTDNQYTTQYTATTVYNETGDIELIAKWTESTDVTIIFETNGGSSVSSIIKEPNETIVASPVTTKTNYTFKGWFTETTLTNKIVFPYTITTDTTMYAKWLRTSPYEPYDPLDPTNPDNLGEGEYNVIKEDSEDCEATDSLCETDGTTYYEKDNKYLIIFNPANGENKIKIEAIYKSFLTEPIYPVYLGHIFKGWYYSDNKWNFSTNTVPASSIELVAKWEVKTAYNVTFNPNNNVQSKKTIEVDEGSLISEPKQPVKLKHKFMGWYYGNKKWDFENDVMVSQDIELIAKWKYIYVNSVDNSDKEDGFLVDNKTDNNKENVIIDNIYESDNDILEDDKFIQVDSESTVVDDVVLPLDSILSDVESVSAELTDSLNKIDMNSKEIDNIDNGSIYKNIELNNYSKEEHENNRTKPYELWEIPEGYHQVEIHKDGTIYYELEEIEEYESDTVVEEYTLTMDEEKYCNWFCNSSSWLTQNCWIILIIFTLLALCLYVIIKNVKILLIVFGVISTLFLILLPCVNYIPILIVLIFILLGILFYLRKRK